MHVIQVYMLLVKWSDQSEKLIYRRYPEMHEFHVSAVKYILQYIILKKQNNSV